MTDGNINELKVCDYCEGTGRADGASNEHCRCCDGTGFIYYAGTDYYPENREMESMK